MDRIQQKKLPAIELIIASIIHKAVIWGDQVRLNFLLERLIGQVVPPKEDLEGLPADLEKYKGLTDADVEARLLKLQARIKRLTK